MSDLSNEQLQELTTRINERLAEFGDVFQPLSCGIVRLAQSILREWQPAQAESHTVAPAASLLAQRSGGDTGITVIAPPRIAYAEAAPKGFPNGNGITITPTRDNGPSLSEFVAFLQRISKAGVMPSMAQFDSLRPAGWATAAAHTKRLELAWSELAQTAGLESRRKLAERPGRTPSPENNAVGDFH